METQNSRAYALALNRKKPTGRLRRTLSQLHYRLSLYNRYNVEGTKVIARQTQVERAWVLRLAVLTLFDHGFKLEGLRSIANRHVRHLMQFWESQGLSASTLCKRYSNIEALTRWIRKPGMLEGIEKYVKDPMSVKRHTNTLYDKSWSGNGHDLARLLRAVAEDDPIVGVQLRLSYAFALRPKEAMLLRPHRDDGGEVLSVTSGTKGGRPRTVPIDTPWQRAVLDEAKLHAPMLSASTIPVSHTYRDWRGHYYYITRKHGLTRANGAQPHGLRHEALQELYEDLAGVPAPVKGDSMTSCIDWGVDDAARHVVANVAGHSRKAIAGAYLGGIVPPHPDRVGVARARRTGDDSGSQ